MEIMKFVLNKKKGSMNPILKEVPKWHPSQKYLSALLE